MRETVFGDARRFDHFVDIIYEACQIEKVRPTNQCENYQRHSILCTGIIQMEMGSTLIALIHFSIFIGVFQHGRLF